MPFYINLKACAFQLLLTQYNVVLINIVEGGGIPIQHQRAANRAATQLQRTIQQQFNNTATLF